MTQIFREVACKGVKVPLSPFLTESRIRQIREARYEGPEISGALAVVREADRVVELGAGLGLVGAITALLARPEKLLSFEADPDLVPYARALYALNGLEARVELRNQVVLGAPDSPGAVGVSGDTLYPCQPLQAQGNRQPQAGPVPTVLWNTIRAEFDPTVLIMDIGGAELDFLTHADLSGLRAIVLEFHPDLYGREGMRACKETLREAGFGKLAKVSTRLVWTCIRLPEPDLAATDPTPPQPHGGWSCTLRTVPDAVVMGARESQLSAPSGVIDAAGADVPEGALWRNTRRVNMPFARPEGTMARLPGRWLWGGVMWRNFAHFVTEGPGRLWGVDAAEGPIDGIVFVPRRNRPDTDLTGFRADFLDALGLGHLPVRVLHNPAEVEELIVPGQGFGLGDITDGTAVFRDFMRRRFGAGIAPEGGEKLYISRALLGPSHGALLGEELVEQALAEQGYEIFHPERYSLSQQIARYKAARRVVASEGSALHLYAFAAQLGAQVAILCRRRSGATGQIARHVAAFTGTETLIVDHLSAVWQHRETFRKRLAIGEPDLPAMQATLIDKGFLSPAPAWAALKIDAARDALGARYVREKVMRSR